MPNIELLERTLAKVEEEAAKPEGSLWRQAAWDLETECGTAYCFAGWACALSGQMSEHGHIVTDGEYKDMFTDDAARRLLGLGSDDVYYLFSSGTGLPRIRNIVRYIAWREKEEEEKYDLLCQSPK